MAIIDLMPPIFGRAYKSDYDSGYGKEFDIREHWSSIIIPQ